MKKSIEFYFKPRHPSGVEVHVPIEEIWDYYKNINRIRNFYRKMGKTARLLESVFRLSSEALAVYEEIKNPYATLGVELQELLKPETPRPESHSEQTTAHNADK